MIKIEQHRQFNGLIKSATISKVPSGKYFVSILVDTEIVELPKIGNKIGVDLGMKEFAITSDEVFFSNPKHLKRSEKMLAKLQKDLSRKQKGSNNRKKARIKVARRMLEYKAKWYGREIIIAPSNYASSQLCSNCGNQSSQTKDLYCRTYICPVCGMIMDRDINASKNLLKLAM